MLSLRELEAQAKALAPVFSQILEQSAAAIRKEFKQQLEERDQVIELLSKDLDSARVDEGAIVEKLLKAIPNPQDGKPGKDADMDVLKAHLEGLVKEIPLPQDGKSVTVDDVRPVIDEAVIKLREEVVKAVSELPHPKDGESVTVDDVRPLLDEMVSKAVADLPPQQPGKDADMDSLRSHLDGLFKGLEIPKGPSVDEVAATFERRFSDLTLSWERQARETFEKAADRIPVPKDGRDALPLESFDMALGDDGRTVTVKLQAGDVVIEKSVKIASVIDRGVYSAEKAYEQGDGATYGGCYWIAQKDSPEGVPGGSADWRLAVKKGRDGKDLRDSASKHDPSKGVSIRPNQYDGSNGTGYQRLGNGSGGNPQPSKER